MPTLSEPVTGERKKINPSLAPAVRNLAAWLISLAGSRYGHSADSRAWEFPADFVGCFGHRQDGELFELFVQPQEGIWVGGADGFYLRNGELNLCFGKWCVFVLPIQPDQSPSSLSIRSTVPPYASLQEGLPLISPWLSTEEQGAFSSPYVLFTPRSG